MRVGATAVVVLAGLCLASGDAGAATLDDIKARGYLVCGVSQANPGFSTFDAKSQWKGFDVDICRAVGAAVFAELGKIKLVPVSGKAWAKPLLAGDIDLLASTTSWTMSSDTGAGLSFPAVTYYDGQRFLVSKKLGVASALELSQATVCIVSGNPAELNVADFFRSRKMPFEPLAFNTSDDALRAYEAERCGALVSDTSNLHAVRLKLAHPDDHIMLPEMISKEPLGPVVRQGDTQWFDLVKWSVFALINAEELGVTSANVDEMVKSTNPEIRRLLGLDGHYGQKMGLDNRWAYRIIKQVGNYGEVFERNLGKGSNLKIARGINALWNSGGILYAPPIR